MYMCVYIYIYTYIHTCHMVLCGDAMGPGHHHDVDVVLALELLLGDDDLARQRRTSILVLGVWDGGAEDADGADDVADELGLLGGLVV